MILGEKKTMRTLTAVALSALAMSASVVEADGIPPEQMQKIYETVRTPHKYGIVLAPKEGHMLDNPMVFRHGDAWYMLYIDFDGKGYETHLATSADLLSWKPLGRVFSRGKPGDWDSAQADGWPILLDSEWTGTNALRPFKGRYWMMYLGGAREGYETDPLSEGVAWTDDPSKPVEWRRIGNRPVLSPSDPDARAFERKTIYKSFVVEDPSRRLGGRFVSYYNAKQEGEWVERIGIATSDDLCRWTRFGDGPCIFNEGALDHGICGDPMVRKIGDDYVMFFFGCNWDGRGKGGAFDTFAASRDLVHWTRWRGPHLVEPSEPWDRTHAHKPWVIFHDGIVYHFYCAVGTRGRALALATSKPVAGKLMHVRCPDRGTWNVRTNRETEAGVEILTVTLTNAVPSVTPAFSVYVKRRQGDIDVRWHSNAWHPNVRPEWRDSVKSDFLSGLPVHSLSSTTGRNRLTLAADDAFNLRNFTCGNDERGCVVATWNVPAGAVCGTEAIFRFRVDARDVAWEDSVSSASGWLRGFYAPPTVPEAAFGPVYSSWYAFHTDVDAARMEREAASAAALGMKSFFMDAGWYMDAPADFGPYAGDWEPSRKRFSNFPDHVARVKAKGLRYVLWFGLPVIGSRSAAHARFKGKFLSEHPGLKASILDPRFPECREYMLSALERALREWGVDGFKIDFIYSMGASGAVAKPGDGRDIADSRIALRRFLDDLHRRITAIRPDVLVEFMHGHGNPAMQTYCNMLRVGDCAGDILENRSAIARMRLYSGPVAVHSDMLVWDAGDAPENAARQVLATLFGTTQFSVGLAWTPPAHQKMIANWIRFMTEHGDALRKGCFRPCHPEANYPLIEGEDGTEVVSAVYLQGFPVRIAVDKRHFVVNATGDGELVVESVREAKAVVFDTFGERKDEVLIKPGLQKIPVPVCGYLSVAG